MLVIYEGDETDESIGPDSSKLSFISEHPRIVRVTKKGTSIFYSSGIFQLIDGPPILVLPWFLKNKNLQSNKELLFFDLIKDVNTLKDFTSDLEAHHQDFNAIDLISYSFLLKLKASISDIISKGFHEERTEQTNVIKGRWHLQRDLIREHTPTKFTCTYGSIERDNHLFRFIKAFCLSLSRRLRSHKNNEIIDQICKLLRDIEPSALNEGSFQDAYLWATRNSLIETFDGSLQFAYSLLFGTEIASTSSGVCYHFQMDKFFEDLIYSVLRMRPSTTVTTQKRDELLGGAIWRVPGSKRDFGDEIRGANQSSVPDIVAFDQKSYFVFECKYKPLRIPFINSESSSNFLKSFERNDRNQILSFLLSIKPSKEMRGKTVYFNLVFPHSSDKKFIISELSFESAKLHIDPVVRNVIQNSIKIDDDKMLSIKFIGIDVCAAINAVIDRDRSLSENIVNSIQQKFWAVTNEEKQANNFPTAVQNRVALAGLVVENLRNDYSLGQVKMAKILYLAESHLKINLMGKYLREIAGPLDQVMIYHEKWGIKSIGYRESIFNLSSYKTNGIVGERFVSGRNIAQYSQRAHRVFSDKIENIISLIKEFSPLNTEQSEIIATLYASWNDLLARGSEASDENIIADFWAWHPSKTRFKKERLLDALTWMKTRELIPDGSGPRTLVKPVKLPSGF